MSDVDRPVHRLNIQIAALGAERTDREMAGEGEKGNSAGEYSSWPWCSRKRQEKYKIKSIKQSWFKAIFALDGYSSCI
jgi:hypothetical protein